MLPNAQTTDAVHPAQSWFDLLTRTPVALDASLDYEATLRRVARLIVGSVADICTFALVSAEPRTLQSTITACASPGQERLLAQIAISWMGSSVPWLFQAINSGRSTLLSRVSDARVKATARSAGELKLIKALGPRSVMHLPLVSRGQALGLVTLVLTTPGREYNAADLAVGQDLARQCALAIDAGQSFRDACDALNVVDTSLGAAGRWRRVPQDQREIDAALLRGLADLDEGASTRAEQALWRMENAIEGLNRIRRNLRGLARTRRRPTSRTSRRRIDLVKVVHAAARGYEPDVNFGQNLDVDSSAKPLLVATDRRRLLQVLRTLLEHATGVSLAGAVRLSAQSVNQGLVVQLEDGPVRGSGSLERIAEDLEGTLGAAPDIPWDMGIAWYVCLEILAQSGARLWAGRGPDGRGTVVQLWLPRQSRQPVCRPNF